ncbi:glycosyltransferase family 61 protein [Wenzhouxiangella limi]|uniref:Glycosyltransferase family 61 protein n=1 Tax=Wenzhouxiangella limi TaxID=2707351 RepID=A0A845V8Q9_9GAMM|nr:glycosyltransferase 61 family protein [Wenzhouxiangella limi]NDY96315.1 glycosyltransferase family 61 protein [Wenzhouxiangella limi]
MEIHYSPHVRVRQAIRWMPDRCYPRVVCYDDVMIDGRVDWHPSEPQARPYDEEFSTDRPLAICANRWRGRNHYHLIFQEVSSLFLLARVALPETLFLTTDPALDRRVGEVFQLACNCANIAEKNVLTVRERVRYRAPQILLIDPQSEDILLPYCLARYQRMTELASQAAVPAADKLYISRQDATARRVLNEAAVMHYLEQAGFTCIIPGNFSIEQQIKLFNRASVIVGPHGAGLTNLLFCKSGTRVIELFQEDFINPAFYKISREVGAHYLGLVNPAQNTSAQPCETIDVSDKSYHRSEWNVDLDMLQAFL